MLPFKNGIFFSIAPHLVMTLNLFATIFDTKKDAKRIKSDNFTRSNREKSSIAIAILEQLMIGLHRGLRCGGPYQHIQSQ